MSNDNTNDIDLSDAGNATCCKTEVQFQKCIIAWYVTKFSSLRQGIEQCISSCPFSAEEEDSLKFILDLYPRGTKASPEDVVVRLTMVDKKDALVLYSCFMCGDSKCEKKYFLQKGKKSMRYGANSHDVFHVERHELFSQNKDILPDDTAVFVCAVEVAYKEITTAKDIPKNKL